MKSIKKKSLQKIIICASVLAVLIAVTIWQLYFSYSVDSVIVKTDEYGQLRLDIEKEYYEDNPLELLDIQISSTPFPSDNADDYIYLFICPEFKNTGIFPLTFTEGYLENVGDNHDTISYYFDLTNQDKVEAFSKGSGGAFSALMYRKGLTDDEILIALKDYKLTFYAKNFLFHELKFEIPLADCEMSIQPLR